MADKTLELKKYKFPKFEGSTGGWLRSISSGEESKYGMAWSSAKEQIFEMPTGGAAAMLSGDNIIYFAKKEQCLSLATQFRTKFKISDLQIFRVDGGEIEYLTPADGVFPEKVNKGREPIGKVDHSIGKNAQPVSVKFTGKTTY